MRKPLWLINISLLVLLGIAELVFLILHVSIPRRFSLQPSKVTIEEKISAFDVDIKKIYATNDLFGTYVPEVPVVAKQVGEEKIPDIPQPPASIPLQIPVEKTPVFIAPLSATLKGVIYMHDSPDQSLAIIMFKDSKQEHNYRVGELIQDAQILKILPNRIIVVRSNGQQETLYLREQDAKKDIVYDEQKTLESFVVVVKDGKHHVPLQSFLKQVHSLGQFIDMLDLITVYKKGKSIGCKIGKASKGSFAARLGFEQDDLVTKIDNFTITDLHSRIEVYDHVIEKKIGDEISVTLDRAGKSTTMIFVLIDDSKNLDSVDSMTNQKTADKKSNQSALYDLEEQKKKILEQRVKLAPTAHQIQIDEQRKLIEARRKNMLSNRAMLNR